MKELNEWEAKDLRITRIAVFKSIVETFEKWGEIEKALAEEAVKWIVGDTFGGGVSQDKLIEMINSFSVGEPAMLEDYEALSEDQKIIVQAIKRAYKRSDLAKSKEVKR